MEIGTSEWTLKLPEIDTKFLCVCVIFYTKDSRFSLLLKGDYDPPPHTHTQRTSVPEAGHTENQVE